jgi:CheY-like chemotaxis protein
MSHKLNKHKVQEQLSAAQERDLIKQEYYSLSEAHERNMGYMNSLHLLIKVFQELGNFNVLEDLLGFIIRSVTRILDADRSTLFLLDHRTQELYSTIAEGMGGKEIRFPVGIGIAGSVAQTRETVLIPDAYSDPRFNPDVDRKTGYQTRNILCMSMCNIENKVIGVIQVLNKHDGDFTPSDITLLTGFCTHAAVSLESTILYTRMEELVEERTRDLASALRNNRDILENIHDGFVIVDRQGIIAPGFSNSCQQLLGQKNLEGACLSELPLQHVHNGDKGVVEQIPSWLDYGWEHPEMENWEALSVQLLQIQGRILNISFQRIFDEGKIKGFMAILSDHTEKYQLEKEVERKNRESMETMTSIMSMVQHGKRNFNQFLETLQAHLTLIRTAFNPKTKSKDEHRSSEVFRNYHTLKGLVQSYSLDYLSGVFHQEEDHWVKYLEEKTFPQGEELTQRNEALHLIMASTDALLQLFIKVYGDPGHQEQVTIPVSEYGDFLGTLHDLKREDIHYWLSQFNEYSFPWLSKTLENEARGIAEDLGKEFIWQGSKNMSPLPRKQVNTLLPVFSHLVRNCLDHGIEAPTDRATVNKPREGKISLGYIRTQTSHVFTLQDDGQGLDLEALKKKGFKKGILNKGQEYSREEIIDLIFTPGFSTKETISKTSGRGVGLDAVKFHVEELGGKISVDSTSGQGTSFTLEFEEKAPVDKPSPGSQPPSSILVVDDNRVMVKLIMAFLADPDEFTTDGCSSPDEALKKMAITPYDIVITDINMPEMSGIDLIPKLKQIHPPTKIIVITGYPSENYVKEIGSLGVEEYLVKPFHKDEIVGAVQNIRQKIQRWSSSIK